MHQIPEVLEARIVRRQRTHTRVIANKKFDFKYVLAHLSANRQKIFMLTIFEHKKLLRFGLKHCHLNICGHTLGPLLTKCRVRRMFKKMDQ